NTRPIWARKHTVNVRRVSSQGCLAFDAFVSRGREPARSTERGQRSKREGRWWWEARSV
ncbi:hypothetical protein B0H10DRAFT_2117464, partial [Mycena sp. CBHHK59/15]